ncbi:TPA: ParA family protein [Sulfurisphaera tokodaii]|nr:ParA family protein [Sulfurisphaera tokodaii]
MGVVNVTSLKGGVGKSTISYQIAKELSKYQPTILIDRSLSTTISSHFGIKDKFPRGIYWKDFDSLRVVNMGCSPEFLSADDKHLMEEFKKYYFSYENIVIDNPSLFTDECFEKFLYNWILITNEFTYRAIVVLTPPDDIIEYTLRMMLPINDFLNDLLKKKFPIIDKVKLFNPIIIVINQVKSDYQINYEKIRKYFRDPLIVPVPFNKEYLENPLEIELPNIDIIIEYLSMKITANKYTKQMNSD